MRCMSKGRILTGLIVIGVGESHPWTINLVPGCGECKILLTPVKGPRKGLKHWTLWTFQTTSVLYSGTYTVIEHFIFCTPCKNHVNEERLILCFYASTPRHSPRKRICTV